MTSISQELNSQRKNALTTREIVTASIPAAGVEEVVLDRVPVVHRRSGRNRITIVSAPMDSARANKS